MCEPALDQAGRGHSSGLHCAALQREIQSGLHCKEKYSLVCTVKRNTVCAALKSEIQSGLHCAYPVFFPPQHCTLFSKELSAGEHCIFTEAH